MSKVFTPSYTLLVVFRILFVFFGFGYIHPDSFFQSPEVIAADVFGFDTVRTWEFEPSLPCRSILTPAIFSGIPFMVLKALSYVIPSIVNPFTLLYFPRLFMLLSSFILDSTVWELSGHDPDALFTLGTSWVLYVIINNGFSNSIETLFVAVALRLVFRPKRTWSFYTLFGAFLAIGIFNRFTFAFYALPLVLYMLYDELRKEKGDWQALLTGIATGFFVSSMIIIVIDSVYFGTIKITVGNKPFRWLDLLCPSFYQTAITSLSTISLTSFSWTITPVNSIQYNLKPENLEQHGTHLRITHLLWNIPLLFGHLAVLGMAPYYFWLDDKLGELIGQPPNVGHKKRFQAIPKSLPKKKEDKKGDKILSEGKFSNRKIAILGVILSPLIILSFAHHQEMRFLYATLIPFIVLGYKTICGSEGTIWTKSGWIAFNIFLLLLFGVFHQGGLVPTILKVASNPLNQGTTHVIFYQTYMPPKHLFAIKDGDLGKSKFVVHDLMGADSTELKKLLRRVIEFYNYSPDTDKILVVSPAAVDLKISLPIVRQQIGHLSGEHWPETLGDWLNLKLNVYEYTPKTEKEQVE